MDSQANRYWMGIPDELDRWDNPAPTEQYVDEHLKEEGKLIRTGPLKFDYAAHPFVSFNARSV